MSIPNFDPAKLVRDVENLGQQVADLSAMISGKSDFKISEVVENLDAVGRIVGDFLPRVQQIESILAPLVPLIPILEKQFSGESAGVGATQTEGVVIPAEEIGKFSDPAPVALESREPVTEMTPDPAPGEVVQEQNADHIPGTA